MASLEFALHISDGNDLDKTCIKPRLITPLETFTKKCYTIRADGTKTDSVNAVRWLPINCPAVIVDHSTRGSESLHELSLCIRSLRILEKERMVPLFICLSLVDLSFSSDILSELCRLAYTNGVDAILLSNTDSAEFLQQIREKHLGLRGRRIKLLLEGVGRFNDAVRVADGVVASDLMELSVACDIILRHKILLTRKASQSHAIKVDLLIGDREEPSTPATTVPSSPVVPSVMPQMVVGSRNFLLNELSKFLSDASRLIIALSDDGASVAELSAQFRTSWGSRRTPPILGLSASESTCRLLGCMYGVIALQTQSFVSVETVVINAIDFAKRKRLVQEGDEVIIVTQPPPVTASTNETCFEGVVLKRTVA
jgi:hypothetical protein